MLIAKLCFLDVIKLLVKIEFAELTETSHLVSVDNYTQFGKKKKHNASHMTFEGMWVELVMLHLICV